MSNILKQLGATSVAAVPHGDNRASFCTCIALTLAASAAPALAEQTAPTQHLSPYEAARASFKHSVGTDDENPIVQRVGIAGTAAGIALTPTRTISELVVGPAVAATTQDPHIGNLAGDWASALGTTALTGPVGGAVALAMAGHSTVVYFQESEQRLEQSLAAVKDRTDQVKQHYLDDMRLTERLAQEQWPEDRQRQHQHYIQTLISEFKNTGIEPPALAKMVEQEVRHLNNGGKPADWLAEYAKVKNPDCDETLKGSIALDTPCENLLAHQSPSQLLKTFSHNLEQFNQTSLQADTSSATKPKGPSL